MKAINWVRWLFAACVCASLWSTTLARYKFRHPQQPQPQIYKKSWPMGPRVSMGNSVHMNLGPSGYKHNRPMQHKPTNYRYPAPPNPVRRPPMFSVLPSWKSQSLMGPLPIQGSLPQRGPVKEFHSMNKLAEYRPEQQSIPSASRGPIDDDKGPIHTIPAPNLSPADKPYNIPSPNYPSNQPEYSVHQNFGGAPQSQATNYVFGTQGTSITPQRMTTGPTSPAPTLHRYEVTESNEIGPQDYRTIQPTFYTPEFDVTRLSNFATTGVQGNDVFNRQSSPSNTGLIGTGIDFGQENAPMQTNLHSSLHVGFPASAIQAQSSSVIEQQTPDLHVGHPAPAGPPLSANQLYDLLNSFPQQFNDQYQSGQQQQQQNAIQQQLDQIFQSNGETQFSQPQMHSFNYDEQSNKKLQQQQQQKLQQQQQQQQQIFVGQDYASGRVTADYSLEPDTVKKTSPRQDSVDNSQSENSIGYEETSNRNGQSTYFTQIGDDASVSSQFYTTLPSRDAAEKLAALAAAGNVNSQLIDHLRKQQHAVSGKFHNAGAMPSNHKDDRYNDEKEEEELSGETRYQQQHPRYVHRLNNEDEREQLSQEEGEAEDKRPLRIMVPDLEDYSEDLDQKPARPDGDYEYEESEESASSEASEKPERHQSTVNGNQPNYRQQLDSEFGSRIGPKSK